MKTFVAQSPRPNPMRQFILRLSPGELRAYEVLGPGGRRALVQGLLAQPEHYRDHLFTDLELVGLETAGDPLVTPGVVFRTAQVTVSGRLLTGRERVCLECGRPFVPTRSDALRCSQGCRGTAKKRAWRKNHPDKARAENQRATAKRKERNP